MGAHLGGEFATVTPVRFRQFEADRLVVAHLGLVRRLAWHVHSRISSAIEIDDLVQVGTIALIEASRCFEDRGEASFVTYATVRVRGSMIDALRKSATMVRSAMRRRREFGTVRAGLESQLGRAATDGEMAGALDLSVADYHRAAEATHAARHGPIDQVYSDRNEWFADDGPDAFENLSREKLKAAASAAISALPPREAMILQLYFVEEMNLDEIGLTLNIGAARVCQIKKAALAKVRASLAGWAA